ncbi:MAG: RNA polymerase sigma factor [Fibrobacterales bacterium]
MSNPFITTSYNDSADDLRIAAAIEGDVTSLNALFDQHKQYIFNVALKMLNNIEDAEDVTQEILLKLITKLSTYSSEKSRFRTWLYRITFNHILNKKQNVYEQNIDSFETFFGVIEASVEAPMSEIESEVYEKEINESIVACMAGMLMCLSREQRLTYIIGEVFQIEHNLAAEIFEIEPAAFRKRLSRARADLHEWIHNRCGLVNTDNPCRCKNKVKSFIRAGYVNPESYKWHSNYEQRIYELSEKKLDTACKNKDTIYANIYRNNPFKSSLKSDEILQEIMGNGEYRELFQLEGDKKAVL